MSHRLIVAIVMLLALALPLRGMAAFACDHAQPPAAAQDGACHEHAGTGTDDGERCSACGACCTGSIAASVRPIAAPPPAADVATHHMRAAPAPDPRRLERPPAFRLR